MDVEVCCIGGRAFLKVGASSIEVKDYKISSSMHGGTEIEVIFCLDGELTEFLSSAKKESLQPQNSTTTNDAP